MDRREMTVRFLLLVLFAMFLWGGEYVQRHLWEPDEARFAYVAREMKWSGHWAVPHRHGEEYAHKPPLLFWMINASSLLTGGEINNISARLPAFAGTVLALWVTGLFAVRLFGRAVFWPSVLVLSTAVLFWHEGGMGRMDALLCGLEILAIYLLITADRDDCPRRRLPAYICIGLAILAKGPVGFVVPIGVYLAATWAVTGGNPFKRHLLWGTLVALVFPAAWLLAAWLEGGSAEYFKDLFFRQNIDRLAGEGEFSKSRPFYLYMVHFPAEFMPWTIFLPAALVALYRKDRSTARLLIAWALFVILFFTLSSGKRNLYILAAYPAAALIVAGGWGEIRNMGRGWAVVSFGIAFLFLLAAVVLETGAGYFRELPWLASVAGRNEEAFNAIIPLFVVPGVVLAVWAVAMLYFFRVEGLGKGVLYSIAVAFICHNFCISNMVFPALNPFKTPVGLAGIVQARLPREKDMLIFGETSEIVPFYCDRHGRSVTDADELMKAIQDIGDGVIIFNSRDWKCFKFMVPMANPLKEFRIGEKDMIAVFFSTMRSPE